MSDGHRQSKSKAPGLSRKSARPKSSSRQPVTNVERGKRKIRRRVRKSNPGGRGKLSNTTLTPPSRSVWLEYVSILDLTPASTKNFAYPIYTNAAFAVDPAAPTGYTTTPGFSVLAANYAAYRVKRYKGSVTFSGFTVAGSPSHLDAISTCVCHTNSALGASSGGSISIDILQFKANRPQLNTVKVIQSYEAGAYGAKVVHTFNHSIPYIVGESIMQPGYRSATNTVPASLSYLVFGWQSPNAIALTGSNVEVKLSMLVEFLDYIDTLTSYSGVETPLSEEARLEKLGQPAQPAPCAGCKYLHSLEYLPCPDPECSVVDTCTNCGYDHKCTANFQSPRCPYRADTVPLGVPKLKKQVSKKLL